MYIFQKSALRKKNDEVNIDDIREIPGEFSQYWETLIDKIYHDAQLFRINPKSFFN